MIICIYVYHDTLFCCRLQDEPVVMIYFGIFSVI